MNIPYTQQQLLDILEPAIYMWQYMVDKVDSQDSIQLYNLKEEAYNQMLATFPLPQPPEESRANHCGLCDKATIGKLSNVITVVLEEHNALDESTAMCIRCPKKSWRHEAIKLFNDRVFVSIHPCVTIEDSPYRAWAGDNNPLPMLLMLKKTYAEVKAGTHIKEHL